MGVKDFNKIEYNGIKMLNLEELLLDSDLDKLSGSTIYIDTSYLVYQSVWARKLKSRTGNDTGHFVGIIENIIEFSSYNIKLIWVMDPTCMPEYKSETLVVRSQKARINVSWCEIEQFLLDLGQTVVKCNNIEAEHYAAYLCKQDLDNSYVLTEDSDVLMYGGNRLSKRNGKYYLLRINDILKAFDITYDELVLICLYLGNDYCPRIPKHGPKSIIKRIKGQSELGTLTSRHLLIKDYIYIECEKAVTKIGELNTANVYELLYRNDFTESSRIMSLIKHLPIAH